MRKDEGRENREETKQAKQQQQQAGVTKHRQRRKRQKPLESVPTQYPLPNARHFVHLRMPRTTLNKMAAVTCKKSPLPPSASAVA